MKLWKSSVNRLYGPHVSMKLKKLFDVIVSDWPFPMWEFQIGPDGGYRTEADQRRLLNAKPPRTKTMDSKHRKGKAIDFTLYWAGTEKAIWDRLAYAVVFGYIWCCARQLDIPITWGGDWNRNWKLLEKKNWEVDLVHVEVE